MSPLRFATAYAVESYVSTAPGWPPIGRRRCLVLSREFAERCLSDVKATLPKGQWVDISEKIVITNGKQYLEISGPYGTFTDVEAE